MKSKGVLEQDMQALNGLLDAAQDALAAGRSIQFRDLEAHINRLCESVAGLPSAEARELQSMLGEMIFKLDQLHTRLTDLQRKWKES